MPYDVESIRKRLKKSMGGKFNDPDQFRPDNAKSTTEPVKYRFFVLPPLMEGDELKAGTVGKTMDQFFVQHADHWVNSKPTPCPRVWDNEDCPICQFGFDLLREEKDENKRREIVKTWMPSTYYMVNIFFTKWEGNPEELRGRVKFYNAPKTCFDIWTAALLRDDKGDEDEPQAHGVFFDESAAFQFQLESLKQGRNNSYKTSKFVTTDGIPIPMLGKKGSINETGIAKLLKLRQNLWDKIQVPDNDKIQRVYSVMIDADDEEDESGGFDDDETVEEAKEEKKETKAKPKSKAKAKAKAKAKDKAKPKKKEKPVDDDVIDDDDDVIDDDDDDVIDDLPDKKPVTESEDFDSPVDDDDKDDDKDDATTDADSGSSEIDSLLNQLEDDE